ncbi:hypothetical protein [Tunturiibacter lichenicola]|uniref:hypothetical protein n=1 Tax=Tunturiibacter lichenicola TaxID=2051959 RepID=UPI0021B2B990|nr:hypothetical protein [Edaphobacter lichenicola]
MRIKNNVLVRTAGCLIALLAVPVAAHAAETKDFAGTWARRLGERNLFVLRLVQDGESLRGSWERPAKFSSDGNGFANMRGGVRKDKVSQFRVVDGALHFTVQNANDPKDVDAYVMRVDGARAMVMFDDLPADDVEEPDVFERVEVGATVALDWEPNRLYTAHDSDVPNTEMEAIYKEDQRVRTAGKIDWEMVNKADAERREQTRRLLAIGSLHTGKDFEEAAFVFQHGDSAGDYLLAHTLAMVAVSKGDATAVWIAAATLDRYLWKVGQKQVLGTQYSGDAKHEFTQEPYDRELVSDALREQLGVPSQASQLMQLKAYQSQSQR